MKKEIQWESYESAKKRNDKKKRVLSVLLIVIAGVVALGLGRLVGFNYVRNNQQTNEASPSESTAPASASDYNSEPNSYYVGVRTISIVPDPYDSSDAWEDAKALATDILNEWHSGKATEDSLVELMDKYGADQGGGQLYVIAPSDFVEEIDVWCFDPARKIGDVAIIENPYGYSICYLSSIIER